MTNELLDAIKKRLSTYHEAKATCDKDDVRVTIPRDQLIGNIEELVAEAKRLQDIVEVYDDRFATLNDEKNKEIAWYKERSLEFDEFALAIGYAERPEGQSGVHRMSGPQLVEVWKARERGIDDLVQDCAVAEIARANAERRYDNLRAKVLTASADLVAATSAPEEK